MIRPVMPSALAPRRFAFPHPAAAAQIEPIVQPLYSYIAFDAAILPNEVIGFKYALGNTVAGAGIGAVVNAGFIHTNMETPGFLASPKLALVLGYRVVIPEITATLTTILDPSFDVLAAAPASALLSDAQRLFGGTTFRFFIGTKDYYVAPTWSVPGNTGVNGVMGAYVDDVAASGPARIALASIYSAGRYEKLYQHKILIPSQQNFFCSLQANQAVPPTLEAARGAYLILDTIFGREVQ